MHPRGAALSRIRGPEWSSRWGWLSNPQMRWSQTTRPWATPVVPIAWATNSLWFHSREARRLYVCADSMSSPVRRAEGLRLSGAAEAGKHAHAAGYARIDTVGDRYGRWDGLSLTTPWCWTMFHGVQQPFREPIVRVLAWAAILGPVRGFFRIRTGGIANLWDVRSSRDGRYHAQTTS